MATPENAFDPSAQFRRAPVLDPARMSHGNVTRRQWFFELPFLVLVADTFRQNGAGEFDAQGQPFVVPTELGPVHLRFRKQAATWPVGTGPHELQEAELDGSISKNASYTQVLAEFVEMEASLPIGYAPGVDDRASEHIYFIIEGLNTFLTLYKLNNVKLYIPHVTAIGIARFVISERHDDGHMVSTLHHKCFENPIPFSQCIGEVEEERIRVDILAKKREPLHELFYEVWNKIALQDYRLAIIESVVLLEFWLSPFLKTRYKAQGLTITDIKRKFQTGHQPLPEGIPEFCDELARAAVGRGKGNAKKRALLIEHATNSLKKLFQKCKEHYPVGIIEICERLVPEITGQEFKGTDDYTDLKNKAILLRNKLVHGERIEASEAEARACIWSVINAVGTINEQAYVKECEDAQPTGFLVIDLPLHPFPDFSKVDKHGKLNRHNRRLYRKDPRLGDFTVTIVSSR